jgi:tetratricopeptide (TPR) repeat protein
MASSARIDELKKKFDENPRRYFAPLANEFRKAGDAEQAIMICEEFLPQQPGHMSGHIVYGQALFDLGRQEEARTVFETALTLDPENLIALRHLGDIARAHGDPEAARRWYERVLEADPRNEEVQQMIAALGEASAPPAEPAQAESAEAESAPWNSAESSRPPAEAQDFAAIERSESAPPPLPRDADEGMLDSFIDLDVVEEQPLTPAASSRMEAPPPDVPFDSISLEGLEPTSAGGSHAGDSARAEGLEPMEFTPPSASAGSTGGFVDDLEAGEFSAPEAPVAPLAGLEESAVGAFERRPDLDSPPPLPGLEPAMEGIDEAPVDIPPEVIAAEAELLDARGETERPAAPPRVTPSQPFVTETMAELYVKQGFREQALDVYTLLLAASPENERLRARVAELQPARVVDSGPNVREFFARLAARRPGEQRAASTPPADDDFAGFETLPELDAAPAPEANPEAIREPNQERSREADSEPRARAADGSIDALFDNRPVGASEDSAASALSQAFGGGTEPPPLSGRPARAAAGELSLDSVFRDGGARPPRSSQSFSFDQFFSESATTERAAEPAPTQTPAQGTGAQGSTPERGADDIEQFNSWLQGLKQR